MRRHLTVQRDVVVTPLVILIDCLTELITSSLVLSVSGHPPHAARSSGGKGRKGRGRGEKNRVKRRRAAQTLQTPTSAGSISRIVKHQKDAQRVAATGPTRDALHINPPPEDD